MSIVSCAIVFFLATVADGFMVRPALPHTKTTSALFSATRPDATQAIQDALDASKKYGPGSAEARIAWEVVEDLDSSDYSEATKGSLEDECEVDYSTKVDAACAEYSDKKSQLEEAISQHIEPTMARVKELVGEMEAIKLLASQSKPAPNSPAVAKALKAAQAAEAEFGRNSPEAVVAWTELEEVASSGVSNAMGVRLDEECLVESAMEACVALDELNRVLNLQKSKDQGLNS